MMRTIDLSVIIVNYNVKYFLEQALRAVQSAQKELSLEIFVVDNNSVDGSTEMVQDKFPDVYLIANPHNPGFSVANNQAIKLAKGKYILLLNPDTVVEEDTFEKCFQFMENTPQAGALGVKMIDGTGRFLPESKRGFPTPFAAFCKTFGLSSIFPKSAIFNRYHLGHLSEHQTHEVDILAGAFMWIRREVLEKVGYLDEQFFMYGEDVDLSYRITLAGYKNYYFSETTIIHYKGESTKKGSLNYVRVFYNAMILFAQKHFQGSTAYWFILLLKLAIYFRAFVTLFNNTIKQLSLPIFDAIIIYTGLLLIKTVWGSYHFQDANYYPAWIKYINFPVYTLIWSASIYFNGSYDQKNNLLRLARGIILGTLFIAAVYGFLPLEYRLSRAIILIATIYNLATISVIRLGLHFVKYKNFNIGKVTPKNLVIVGSLAESERVQDLLRRANIQKNLIGTVSPFKENNKHYISSTDSLSEVVKIYNVEEIIFCSKDVRAEGIIEWMTKLGSNIDYKIVPNESLIVIGSHSKNAPGELYTIDIQYNIAQYLQRRNKRILDILVVLVLLITLPIHLIFISNRTNFIKNIVDVLLGKKTWVGYNRMANHQFSLPTIRQGITSIADHLNQTLEIDEDTLARLNFFYAKDYSTEKDIVLILKNYRRLGDKI
jgi:GT2 family glycosyltransferase